MLYVPRGTYHRAAVTDTDSVHLTFGIQTYKGVKFLEWLVRRSGERKVFREDILTLGGPQAFAEQERVLKARLCEIINETSVVGEFPTMAEESGAGRSFPPRPEAGIGRYTMFAPLLRSRQAWRDSVEKKGKEPSAAGERIIESLLTRILPPRRAESRARGCAG